MKRVSEMPDGGVDVALETPGTDSILSGQAVLRFGHRAMATLFEVLCVHEDQTYALQAANQAFDLLDKLEGALSRFVENSDIGRINDLPPGGTAKVSRWTMECLLLARWAIEETSGAFDISLGTGLRSLELQPRDYTVRVHDSPVHLDLGGIGKGYAVDRMADALAHWGIDHALIHGGCSSVRALDPPAGVPGWPLGIAVPGQQVQCANGYSASQCVLSASGTQKGNHIVDPRTSKPIALRPGAWVIARIADLRPIFRELGDIGGCGDPVSESPSAVAEIFSTAFLILSLEEVEACGARRPTLETWLAEPVDHHSSGRCSLVHLTQTQKGRSNSGGTICN